MTRILRSPPPKAGVRGPHGMSFYVYILTNRRNGTLYVGMTDDLVKRVWMHKTKVLAGFTKEYGVKVLVWYAGHTSLRQSAFARERQIKKWNSCLEARVDRENESKLA